MYWGIYRAKTYRYNLDSGRWKEPDQRGLSYFSLIDVSGLFGSIDFTQESAQFQLCSERVKTGYRS